jgi:hypothetical protein
MVDIPRIATVSYCILLLVTLTDFIEHSSNGNIVYITVSRHSGSQSRKGSKGLEVHF